MLSVLGALSERSLDAAARALQGLISSWFFGDLLTAETKLTFEEDKPSVCQKLRGPKQKTFMLV